MESMFSSNRPGWAALLDEKVTAYLPDLKYIHDEPLARHTSFRIGGPATRMAFPTSGEQIVLLTGFAQECGVTPFLLGNGTNLLVADEGLDTLVIQTGEGLNRIALDGGIITADAGVSLARLGVFAWQHSLTGLEFAHGIPGSLGGGRGEVVAVQRQKLSLPHHGLQPVLHIGINDPHGIDLSGIEPFQQQLGDMPRPA